MSHPVQPEVQAPQPDPLHDSQPDPQARVQELEIQLAAERAAHEFDVPAVLLAGAQSAEDIDRLTSEALLWQAETAPPPPPPRTAAVSVSESMGLVTSALATESIRATSKCRHATACPV
jgi:hypothetical protein